MQRDEGHENCRDAQGVTVGCGKAEKAGQGKDTNSKRNKGGAWGVGKGW
jgi:hypothetical protein